MVAAYTLNASKNIVITYYYIKKIVEQRDPVYKYFSVLSMLTIVKNRIGNATIEKKEKYLWLLV